MQARSQLGGGEQGPLPYPTMDPGSLPPRRSIANFAKDLARGPIPPFHGKVTRVPVSDTAPRILYLTKIIRSMCMEWLSRRGGYRNKTVFVKGRRKTGRIWESPMWETLDLKFSQASLDNLISGFEYSSGQTKVLQLHSNKTATIADQIFSYLLVRRMLPGSKRIQEFWEDADGTKVELNCPLLVLYNPDVSPLDTQIIDLLQATEYGIILNYLDRDVATQWLGAEKRRSGMKASEALPYYNRFGEFLSRWFCQIQKTERFDLLTPLSEYFRIVVNLHGKREAFLRKIEDKIVVDIYSASEREQFRKSLGRIYKLGEQLEAVFDECRSRAYVERTASDHMFLASYHDIYRPISEDIKAIGRRFSGEIG
jgi:hypothetical protein